MARTWVVQSTGWYQPHSDETAAAQTALLDRRARHPREFEKVRQELSQIVAHTIPGDFRTLLAAAESAL